MRTQKTYPGYIMVQMAVNEQTWHTVTSTAKVTGFLGNGASPTPIPDEEAERVLRKMDEGLIKPKYYFEEGEKIRVVDGVFNDFQGIIEEVSPDSERLKVRVNIFGRPTPVELHFAQVNKM